MTALADVRELLGMLEAQMRAKGHERAAAKLSIRHGKPMQLILRTYDDATQFNGTSAFVTPYGGRSDVEFIEAQTLEQLLSRAHDAIARMDQGIAKAMAPWFEGPAP
jgi:hypothetical protein